MTDGAALAFTNMDDGPAAAWSLGIALFITIMGWLHRLKIHPTFEGWILKGNGGAWFIVAALYAFYVLSYRFSYDDLP